MTKEALKLALEALENPWKAGPDGVADAIIAIKEALAQPEQKSVAMADYMALTEKYVALKAAQPEQERFMASYEFKQYGYYKDEKGILKLGNIQAAQPPQRTWVGLTDEEYTELWGMKPDLLNFFHKIEAKLKEKNT